MLNTINKFGVTCVSGYYFDSTLSSDNEDINIKGYKSVRVDHPTMSKGMVFVRILENLYHLG